MLQNCDVTVYVPCRGDENVSRALDGLLAQTVTPARILIIDTTGKAEDSLDNHVRDRAGCPVEVVAMSVDSSLAAIRNKALELCETPLLASLDADVMPAPDWLEMLSEAIYPRCHCLADKAEKVCGVGGKTDYLIPPAGEAADAADGLLNWGDEVQSEPRYIWSANSIFKAAVLRAVGGFPEGDDTEIDRLLAEAIRAHDGVLLYMPSIRCAKI